MASVAEELLGGMLNGMTRTNRKPPATPAEELPLTVPEAAAELRIATATLRRWIAQGTVVSIRPGRQYLIPRQELDRLLGRRRPEGMSA